MSEPLKHISPTSFLSHSNTILGASNAKKIFSAYDITSSIHPNAFWTKLMYLMGDIMFSEPSHKFVNYLASQPSTHKKHAYRYTMTMRNPFPGSNLHQIPGHHFVDLLFLFQTLRERSAICNATRKSVVRQKIRVRCLMLSGTIQHHLRNC